MFERFTDRARKVVVLAQDEVRRLNHHHVEPEHILLGLIRQGEGVGVRTLETLGISPGAVRQQVEEIIGQGQQAPPSGHLPFTPRAKTVLELSLREALQLGHNYIGTEHILLGLIRQGDGVAAQVLVKLGADYHRVRLQVIQLLHGYQGKGFASAASGSTESAPATSLVLDQFGRNLTQGAREGKGDPVIGREKEIERVMQVLARRSVSSPVLIGEPGVGKSAVAEGLAQEIASGEVLGHLRDKLVYRLEMGMLTDSPISKDELNRRMQIILKETLARGDVLLFIEGPLALTIDVWVILKPMLGHGDLQIIGALEPEEYRALLDEHPALQRTLIPVQVAELTVSRTIEILKGLRNRYEAHHQVGISDTALKRAAELADHGLPGRRLPGKAIELVDEAAALGRVRNVAEVDENLIAEALAYILDVSPERARDAPHPPRFAPAAMTDDDREIWAIS